MVKKRIHLKVHGRVQGVFYRVSTREKALRLNLSGDVMNMPDGSVEINAEGDELKLMELISWAKHGPSLARVRKVDVDWFDDIAGYSDFKIRSRGWY
ncbi:MAG: acylphosphatase [Candidatus Hodarchaeales archaeon]